MSDFSQLIFSAIAGFGLGLFFYGGLYFTITRGLSSRRPELWFIGSFFLRMGLVLTAFYFISDGHWQRLIACLLVFIVTGVVLQLSKQSPLLIEKVPDQLFYNPYEP